MGGDLQIQWSAVAVDIFNQSLLRAAGMGWGMLARLSCSCALSPAWGFADLLWTAGSSPALAAWVWNDSWVQHFVISFFIFSDLETFVVSGGKKKATPTTGSLLLRLCWGDVPVHSCHRNTEQCNAPAATKHTNQFPTAKPSGTNKPSRNCTERKIQTGPLCSALPMSCPTGWNCSVVPELCSSQQWGSARRKCFAHCFDASILSSAPDSQKGGWVKSLWEHSRGWISQLDASWKFGAEHTSLRSCFLAEFPSGFVYFFLIIFGHFGGRFFAIPTRRSVETFMLHVAQHHSSCPETTNGHLEGICSWRKFPFTCNNEKSINAQNTMMNTILSHSGATSLPYWYHQKMLVPLEASSQLSFLIIPHSIQPFLLLPYCHSTTFPSDSWCVHSVRSALLLVVGRCKSVQELPPLRSANPWCCLARICSDSLPLPDLLPITQLAITR